uniref:RRM domain-containing protein n=1 Tax=Chromera velia CCMP2878 TaxID=1169474 RepID=A0A0G4GRU8_9ALVE|mmetsp:Transcript_33440/g.66305  ORF Transcript_33440/g.66305 Transcript_33440/m.66305 type:complete len:193 (-) Transcript_33440:58-636(-)|eukprot:Cvel_23113.t1-p1 / transcript=Cvel_23113.t1 / gene=Cvel_23113 / organism=Chromera_velia_CCMP2878 / gene_product=hypothetical protein / transcript_product=hypothetical protein / location=Cvel_scaffold2347:876-3720(-) / protein_length=192 / sequence_SO=supercontig / SO=protein_coding / is_pseudo=false
MQQLLRGTGRGLPLSSLRSGSGSEKKTGATDFPLRVLQRASRLRENSHVQRPTQTSETDCVSSLQDRRHALAGGAAWSWRSVEGLRRRFFCRRSLISRGPGDFYTEKRPPRLRIRGLRWDVKEESVRNFFQGYALAEDFPETIDILTAPDGRMIGQAFVYFLSDDEARRAKRELNRKPLEGRSVELLYDLPC